MTVNECSIDIMSCSVHDLQKLLMNKSIVKTDNDYTKNEKPSDNILTPKSITNKHLSFSNKTTNYNDNRSIIEEGDIFVKDECPSESHSRTDDERKESKKEIFHMTPLVHKQEYEYDHSYLVCKSTKRSEEQAIGNNINTLLSNKEIREIVLDKPKLTCKEVSLNKLTVEQLNALEQKTTPLNMPRFEELRSRYEGVRNDILLMIVNLEQM